MLIINDIINFGFCMVVDISVDISVDNNIEVIKFFIVLLFLI